jgi:hypothetical protein
MDWIGLYAAGFVNSYLSSGSTGYAKFTGEVSDNNKELKGDDNQFVKNGYVDKMDDLFGDEKKRKSEIDNRDIPIGAVIVYCTTQQNQKTTQVISKYGLVARL